MKKKRRTGCFWKVPLGLLLAGVILGLPLLAILLLMSRGGWWTRIGENSVSPQTGSTLVQPLAVPFAAEPSETILLHEDPNVRQVVLGPLETEQPPRILAGKENHVHDGEVHAAVFAPDGRHILSAGEDGTIRLADVETGKERTRLEGHAGPVYAVVFVGGPERAASAGADGTLRLWDLKNRKESQCIAAHSGGVRALAITSDGRRILTGGVDRAMRLWDAASGKQLDEYFGHDGSVLSVAFSPDGKYALSGSTDGGVLTWELATGREHNFINLGNPARVLRVLPDGHRAVIGGDWTCCYWNVLSGERWIGPSGGKTFFRAAAILPSGYVLTGGVNRQLELNRLPRRPAGADLKQPIGSLTIASIPNAHDGTINAIDVTADGSLALTAGADGRIRLWRFELPPYLSLHDDPIYSLAVEDAGRLAVTSARSGLMCWDLVTATRLRSLTEPGVEIRKIALSHDGKLLFSAGTKDCHLWEAATGRELRTFDTAKRFPESMLFSADNAWIGCGSRMGAVWMLNVQTGDCPWAFRRPNHPVEHIQFLPNRRLLTASNQGECAVWDTATGAVVRCYRFAQQRTIRACASSPDGRRLWVSWTKGKNEFVSAWDLTTGREIVRFTGSPRPVTRLVLSPDGRTLAGSSGRDFHVWNVDPPTARWNVRRWQGDVTALVFLSGGRQLLVADNRGGLRRWDLPNRP